jgi:transcriptional regulator with XRE-family HTH domain
MHSAGKQSHSATINGLMMSSKLDHNGKKIRAMMILRDVKQVDICRQLRVNSSTVSLIVSGKKKSARIRAAIAEALGFKVEELWPSNGHKRAA